MCRTAASGGELKPDLEFRVLSVVGTAGLVPLLLWRRTHPLLMVAIGFTVSAMIPLFTGGWPIDMMAQAHMVLLPYALFRWGLLAVAEWVIRPRLPALPRTRVAAVTP